MGIFSAPNPFDGIVEKVTDAKNTSEDWGHIMDLCDQVSNHRNGSKDCLRAIVKRLNHQDPHVVLQAITVLDACANNCGKEFRLEVASREFENEFRKLLGRTQPKVQEKLRGLLKTWAEGEFKGDSQLNLIPSLYNALKKEGVEFSSTDGEPKKRQMSKDPNVVSSQQEEDDIAKAIQLSLQDSKSSGAASGSTSGSKSGSTLYPSMGAGSLTTAATNSPKKEEKKARALYDFEAAEDNELTFKAGEIVIIIDDSDQNWWKGSNHRGEGLFPANFVSPDLNAEPDQFKDQRRRSVQFNEEVEVVNTVEIDQNASVSEIGEEKIDKVLELLHEADPTQPETDPPELPGLEDQVYRMGPLIDTELEAVDRRHAQLTRLSTELVDALNLYHQLMHENTMFGAMPPGAAPHMPPNMPPHIPASNGGFNPYAGPNSIPPQPTQFNGYYPPPPGAPNGAHQPPMVGYPGTQMPPGQAPPAADSNQMYAGSAPPPPTPPMDPKSQPQMQQQPPPTHFTSAPQSSVVMPGFGMNGGQPVAVSGYNPPMPQM